MDKVFAELVKNGETYLIIIPIGPDSLKWAESELGKWAGDPELGFSWFDAAYMIRVIQKRYKELTEEP